jgi:hypothetical protein
MAPITRDHAWRVDLYCAQDMLWLNRIGLATISVNRMLQSRASTNQVLLFGELTHGNAQAARMSFCGSTKLFSGAIELDGGEHDAIAPLLTVGEEKPRACARLQKSQSQLIRS